MDMMGRMALMITLFGCLKKDGRRILYTTKLSLRKLKQGNNRSWWTQLFNSPRLRFHPIINTWPLVKDKPTRRKLPIYCCMKSSEQKSILTINLF